MVSYVLGRLLQSIPVLFLASIGVFFFIRLVPGDPAATMAGVNATPDQIEALRHRWGLDQPLVAQYLTWMGNVLRGDLGTAYVTERPISSIILQRIPPTAHLAVGSMVVIVLIGMPLGIFCAVRPYHPLTRLISLFNAVAISVPTFWLGILLLLFFAVNLRWFPPSGFVSITENPLECIRLLVLPSITLGLGSAAVIIRFLRSALSDVMVSDFVRTAYAKGLPERLVISRHVLRIAMLPVITVMAVQFGYLLGGALITEAIFGWPGLGRLVLDAISTRDYLIMQSTMLLFVATFIVLNIIADVCYALLDPRIRYDK